jgi:hypothetical protein
LAVALRRALFHLQNPDAVTLKLRDLVLKENKAKAIFPLAGVSSIPMLASDFFPDSYSSSRSASALRKKQPEERKKSSHLPLYSWQED